MTASPSFGLQSGCVSSEASGCHLSADKTRSEEAGGKARRVEVRQYFTEKVPESFQLQRKTLRGKNLTTSTQKGEQEIHASPCSKDEGEEEIVQSSHGEEMLQQEHIPQKKDTGSGQSHIFKVL